MKQRREGEVEQLEAQGNYKELVSLCKTRSSACDAKRRVAAKRLANASCDTLVDDVYRYHDDRSATKASDTKLMEKLAQCNQTHLLFERGFPIRWLDHALVAADRNGAGLFEQLMEYLTSGEDRFGGSRGVIHADVVARWLIAVDDESRCSTLDSAFGNVAEKSQGRLMWIYNQVGCEREALAHAPAFIQSERVYERIEGCTALGAFGDASALDKLEVLATTDPHKADREVRTSNGSIAVETYFPVRETCLAAAGKIRIRM